MDKRHVGMKSSTMETRALKNALERLKNVAKVTEVCTDASSSVKKLVGNYYQLLCYMKMFINNTWNISPLSSFINALLII